MSIDGFYAGYFAGTAGTGMAMFVLLRGTITGADISGVTFDGTYIDAGDGFLTGSASVKVPPGATVVQGVTAPPQGLVYEVPFRIPSTFEQEPFFELKTPLGAVNFRLTKTRSL